MPATPLPEACPWPRPAPPSRGLVPALLGYITLINSRLPLLEYRGCHGMARICFAAPYGMSSEVGRRAAAGVLLSACITNLTKLLPQ